MTKTTIQIMQDALTDASKDTYRDKLDHEDHLALAAEARAQLALAIESEHPALRHLITKTDSVKELEEKVEAITAEFNKAYDAVWAIEVFASVIDNDRIGHFSIHKDTRNDMIHVFAGPGESMKEGHSIVAQIEDGDTVKALTGLGDFLQGMMNTGELFEKPVGHATTAKETP